MSDTIIFDTEAAVQNKPLIQEPILFQLVNENDPILKEVMPEFDFSNPPVDPNAFASTLVETCKYYRGLGLSANQCGFRYRVFVMGGGSEFVSFFNPKLISTSGEKHMGEGCLSFPLLELKVTRPETIDVEYQTFTGELKQAKFTGLTARCFLHELDHMNGIVYTSRAKPMALTSGNDKRKKLMKMMNRLRK
jgi:peptide deformylase